MYENSIKMEKSKRMIAGVGIHKLLDIPRSTSLNGLPLAKIMLSPTIENASSGVHSAIKEESCE